MKGPAKPGISIKLVVNSLHFQASKTTWKKARLEPQKVARQVCHVGEVERVSDSHMGTRL